MGGWMNGTMDGWMTARWTDEWMDGQLDSQTNGSMYTWLDGGMEGQAGGPAEWHTHPSPARRQRSNTSGLISATRAFKATALCPICLPPLMWENGRGGEVISCVLPIETGFVS